MKTIDGKYFLLEQSDMNSMKRVKRADGKHVERGICPQCSAQRKAEHRRQPCLAVYPDEGWAYCYNCGNWFWTEEWYNRHIAPKRRGGTQQPRKAIDLSLLRDDFPQAVIDYFEKERRSRRPEPGATFWLTLKGGKACNQVKNVVPLQCRK